MAIGLGLGLLALVLLGLATVGLVAGGIALNRRHRREDAARSADRVNGP
ncbi:hypothetical protein [Egicoccus halophilus]|uniref:Uncharacterized protein n=1 Tax=Egicoccus halophilus TaxID=1670830 RepID=A0A8J3AAE3_9ACTN|nr:hypothetical protein [Egicoccus halophilus]GGI06470.1 hypothetical protein GCM10011354_19250 [Egicoccus halophilus]